MPTHRALVASLALLAAPLLALTTPASAEEPVVLTGLLVVAHEDDFESHRSRHVYGLETADGARTTLRFADEDRAHALSGRQVQVQGERRGGTVHVAAVEETGSQPAASSDTASTGAVHVAVVPFSFADKDLAPPPDQLRTLMFAGATGSRTVEGFFDEVGYGQQPTSGVVHDTVRINASSTDACNYTAWGAAARSAIGLDETAYTHVAHVMPPSTCQFGGVAYLPGTYSWTVTGAIVDEQTERRFRGIMEHELGHNLGAHHGGSYACTSRGVPVVLSSKCTLAEYGDPNTTMGTSWGERHFNAFQKGSVGAHAATVGRLPWLADAATEVVTASRELVLQPLEGRQGTTVLQIPKPGSRSDYYYVEYRDGTGLDQGDREYVTATSGRLVNEQPLGVTIRIAPSYGTRAITKLLDMTPGTASFADAELVPGTPFVDGGLTIENLTSEMAVLPTIRVTISATKGRK